MKIQFMVLLPALMSMSIILTYVCRSLALKFNVFIDHPNSRSSHNKEIPRSGGLAIIVVFFAAMFFIPAFVRAEGA